MKVMPKATIASFVLFCVLMFIPAAVRADTVGAVTAIPQWGMKWEAPGDEASAASVLGRSGWFTVHADDLINLKPSWANGAWIKMKLPSITDSSGIFIKMLHGRQISVFNDGKEIFHVARAYDFDSNRILLPLSAKDSGQVLLIHAVTTMEMLGISESVLVGNYQELSERFLKTDLFDIVLGSAFFFVSLVMLLCSVFLSRTQLAGWISLSVVIMTVGTIIVTYSPFLFTYYGQYGRIYLNIFDISLIVFTPALTLFYESMFGEGYRGVIRKFRIFQTGFSLLCLVFVVLHDISPAYFYESYRFVTLTLIGVMLVAQFLLLAGSAASEWIKGSRDAIIITSGFGVFAAIAVSELVWFFVSEERYYVHLWKWGVVGFIFSLIVLLGKRFAFNHAQIVQYSRDLEIYNYQLQRSEKMEVISQLAASVAHEVRNPLQVTRGFLQLLGDSKHNGRDRGDKERSYLRLAIEELDRASSIITNYLTFAKPQLEEITVLDLAEELKHVEGILEPLANSQGGKIDLKVQHGLYVNGNSSKLKQAIINIMKNSIESLRSNGRIHLWAYEEQGEVVIHIRDNGEGMDETTLKRLGEPYFSNKTKGTGLGLMVTFRIIELMRGKLEFRSEKGNGTEAVIRFPAAKL